MAVERIFLGIKQSLMIRASELTEESALLLRAGHREEAEAKMTQVRKELAKTRAVDTILPDVLKKLKAAGIEKPSIEFLEVLVAEHGEKFLQPLEEDKVETATKEPYLDLGEREEKILHSAFMINDQRNGFENESWNMVWRNAYSDILDEITDKAQKKEKEQNLRGTAYQTRLKIVRKLQDTKEQTQLPPRLARFFDWIKDQPEYTNLSMDDMVSVVQRQITFEDLRQKTEFPASTAARPDEKTETLSSTAPTPVITELEQVRGPIFKEEAERSGTINLILIQEEKAVVVEGGKINLKEDEWLLVDYLYKKDQAGATPQELIERVHADKQENARAQSLYQTLYSLRKKLGESGRTQRLLQSQKEGNKVVRYILVREAEPTDLVQTSVENHVPSETSEFSETVNVLSEDRDVIEETNLLSTPEIYMIAKALDRADEESLSKIGITLHPDDKREINSIASAHATETALDGSSLDLKTLLKKLSAFVKNREKVFTQNMESDEAQFLLTVLVGINTEEQIKSFFNPQL